MRTGTHFIFILFFSIELISCHGQVSKSSTNDSDIHSKQIVGGGCDGCELMYIDMPPEIESIDTSAGWAEAGQKLLITGKALMQDGKTPAPDVIIYYWQTDNNGYYSPRAGMNEQAKRHGHIRGWVKTDSAGNYAIYTIRPAPYPKQTMPAHIHISIKEPSIKNEYYIDELVFDDDKLLTTEKRNALENRGGSGVLRIYIKDSVQIAEHNIILGLHIPNYPSDKKPVNESGLQVGEDQPSFTPFHAFGPDKGTKTCPVCKYGRYQGILYFAGNNSNWEAIKKWLAFLDHESAARNKYLKVYFVYGNDKNYNKEDRQHLLEKTGELLGLKNIALTFVPSFSDKESDVFLNNINPSVENTFIIYRNRNIIDKYINLSPTSENFKLISTVLDQNRSAYADLPEPVYN